MWPSLVINLADNTRRMENSATALTAQGLPFERIEAVNGWQMDEAEVVQVYDAAANRRRARHPLVRPEIGCYLSHIAAWERIAEAEAAGGFVFEDDFQAGDDLAAVLGLLSQDSGSDWDMVKLFSFDRAPKCVRRRALDRAHELVIPYRVPTCLIGYGLTRDAARHLAARARPFFRPVDEDQKFFWETGLRVALVLPPPVSVGDQQTVTGTIGKARRSAGEAGGLARFWRGLRYQAHYRAALHWHRARGTGS
ncbi:glycosyl transferase family 25 [Maritimibacter sp. 55A14]|uniref:glycosyltransferase family 25 protein n=1 Tax=Maritimibacter sp. 55A14 TaxID=2174844 RepID=UPI000D6225B3|nr:glycosyltransferase family 25 protein [Maritimibacter sp. 55A14]PWE32217.1 glycosyl transferase family 25 [Maritimibacter sp. 55A14]